MYNPVFDEASRQDFIDMNELKMRLFEAKWNWTKDKVMKQKKLTTMELLEEGDIADEHDAWVKDRVEFMYDYLDFNTERKQIRLKFLNEMHKKTSLKDIGELLDEFILTSKAGVAENFDAKHILEQPSSPQKEKSERDFDWYESIVSSFDPRKPNWLDDETQIDEVASDERFLLKELMNEIKFKDSLRDHSIGSLTAQER